MLEHMLLLSSATDVDNGTTSGLKEPLKMLALALSYSSSLSSTVLIVFLLAPSWTESIMEALLCLGRIAILSFSVLLFSGCCFVGISDKQMAGNLLSGVFLAVILLPRPLQYSLEPQSVGHNSVKHDELHI